MNHALHLFAGLTLLLTPDHLSTPAPVRFALRDGTIIAGFATDWTTIGVDGTFGPHQWAHLRTLDACRLYFSLMDQNSGQHWLQFAQMLQSHPDGDELAGRAFRWAKWLGNQEASRILIESYPPRTGTTETAPESQPAKRDEPGAASRVPIEHWKGLTPEEDDAAVAKITKDTNDLLRMLGIRAEPLQGRYFLLYGKMTDHEADALMAELDRIYEFLCCTFDVPEDRNMFWGRCAVVLLDNRAQLAAVSREAFKSAIVPEEAGFCHMIGPRTIVMVDRAASLNNVPMVLAHEVTHAFLHRLVSDAQLPMWLEEGAGDYIAAVAPTTSRMDRHRRVHALRFIHLGGEVNDILDMGDEGMWPGPNGLGYCVSYLLVRMMAETRPDRIPRFIAAIKNGKPWPQALEDDFGESRSALIERLRQHYAVKK